MKRWIKAFFYDPKHEKPTDENITRLLMPSVMGIIICLVCMAGLSYAWFTTSIQTDPQKIQAANYTLNVSVSVEDNAAVTSSTLEAGNIYTVMLTPDGNATTGYCVVEWKCGDNSGRRYTAQITTGNYNEEHPFIFSLKPSATGSFTFTPQWGTYSGSEQEENLIKSGDTVEIPNAPQSTLMKTETPSAPADTNGSADKAEYVVQKGDTLVDIAGKYATTVDKLAAYNGIQDRNYIQAGQTLKIPPADYELPESTEPTAPAVTADPTEKPAASETAAPPASEPEESTPAAPSEEPTASAPEQTEDSGASDSASTPSPLVTEPEAESSSKADDVN